jgi:uncharacterized protein YbaP (TraB family)
MGEAYRIGHNISKCMESVMQNRSYVRGLLLLLLSLFWVCAPLRAETENTLLWRIQTPDGAVSHLFGTIHSDDPKILALPEPVTEAFDAAPTLVLEMDLGAVDDKAMGEAMLLPPGKDLLSLVGTELYSRSVIAMGERGYPEGVINRMQPWAIVMTLSMPQPESGMFLDYVLFMGAREQNKKVAGLERMAEQLAVFTSLNNAEQVTLLRDTLRDYKRYPQLFEKLIAAYLKQDLDELTAISKQEMTSSDKALEKRFMRTLVEERNHRMAERLLPMLERGGVFAAVGALHLPGEEGLIALLREQGLTVTPVY